MSETAPTHGLVGSSPPAGGYTDGVDPVAPDPSRFTGAIRRFPPARLQPADVCRRQLLLVRDGPLELYYAPFEDVNPDARVTLVGICPSLGQAARAAGRLDPDRCLFGFPHPSGANAGRVAAFDEQAGPLARRARAWLMPSDRGSG